ncbi:aldehyde dehydrogenase family protein [Clostridium omnivorum]|uniref:Aldehyde dehydrogenase n=1 Tax=Clostridium omnivorum TaxID=1604902 RepID=A0ABQ5NCT6_9CLOT|nr:aldehyde dehydrogenase family protein [Clostridium sp. E14]GLC32857.1 aldehyde dehydrogenase [Clostridium sp. E14]
MNPLSFVKKDPYKLYINGEFVASESGKTFDIVNPVNNEAFAKAYKGGAVDAKKAILAARKAYDEGPWSKMSAKERSKLLIKAGQILSRRLEEFAAIETLECGKLYTSVLYYEAQMSVDAFEYFAGKARCIEGKVIPSEEGHLNYVLWQPCGVVGEILPWNGPLMMGCQKVCAILAAGNTVVIKPSSWASLSMLLIAEVFHEAGFPAGVLNIVTGSGDEVGDVLVTSPLVDMVSMTGGTDVGKKIIGRSKETVKDIALELGGKSPNIVFDDVNTDEVIKWARFGFTLNSGQVCVSGTRLILHKKIYEEFIAKLKAECEKFVPGNGFDYEKGVNFGTLISKEHAKNVWSYIEKGKSEGARLIMGGEPYTDTELSKGNFVPPTIFADVTPNMTIFQEEIFGPILCVTPFETEKEAIELANATRYGLAGAVFSKDIKRALRVAEHISGGQIYVNTYFSKGMIESPGTGWKESGIGVAGIQKYMMSKTVFVDMIDGSIPQV